MIKKQDKKGQIFTIIAISLIVLIFVSFEIFGVIRANASIKTRVSSMDSFLHSVEKNLEKQLYLVGFRAILVANEHITLTNDYVDFEPFVEETFFNGTVYGVSNDLLFGATYSDLVDSINIKAAKINVDIEMNNTQILVSQDDPWHVKFTMISDFSMYDKGNLARWDKIQTIIAYVPVTWFDDPLYTVSSSSKLPPKTITRTVYTTFVDGADVSNLSNHYYNRYYKESIKAPSFLNRLEGNFSASPYGIESFVPVGELENNGVELDLFDPGVIDETVVDYLFFDVSSNIPGSQVAGMDPDFRIDDGNKLDYGL